MEALNVYSLSLILNKGRFSCVKAYQILGFVSHDHLSRQFTKEWMPTSVADWALLPKRGVLVIDDTVIVKPDSQAIEGVKWQYASSKDKVYQALICCWPCGWWMKPFTFLKRSFQVMRTAMNCSKPFCVAKHGEPYLLTNETVFLHTSQTLAEAYAKRWVVETVFRDLKTVLHLEKCACRNLDAPFNHVLYVLEAYLFLWQAFPSLSVQGVQQEYLRLYRCPNC